MKKQTYHRTDLQKLVTGQNTVLLLSYLIPAMILETLCQTMTDTDTLTVKISDEQEDAETMKTSAKVFLTVGNFEAVLYAVEKYDPPVFSRQDPLPTEFMKELKRISSLVKLPSNHKTSESLLIREHHGNFQGVLATGHEIIFVDSCFPCQKGFAALIDRESLKRIKARSQQIDYIEKIDTYYLPGNHKNILKTGVLIDNEIYFNDEFTFIEKDNETECHLARFLDTLETVDSWETTSFKMCIYNAQTLTLLKGGKNDMLTVKIDTQGHIDQIRRETTAEKSQEWKITQHGLTGKLHLDGRQIPVLKHLARQTQEQNITITLLQGCQKAQVYQCQAGVYTYRFTAQTESTLQKVEKTKQDKKPVINLQAYKEGKDLRRQGKYVFLHHTRYDEIMNTTNSKKRFGTKWIKLAA